MKIRRENRKKCQKCDTLYPGWRRFGPGPYDLEPCGCDEPPEDEAEAALPTSNHAEPK